MYNGAARPCSFPGCELSEKNSVHKDKRQFGYHTYMEPIYKERSLTLEERVEALERRMSALDGETV